MIKRNSCHIDSKKVQFPNYHYVLVRNDLPVGVAAAQIVHAAGESSERVPSGTHAVVLGVDSEAHLTLICEELNALSIKTTEIRETTMNDSLTAVGLEPVVDRSQIKKVLSKLPLYAGVAQT